MTLKCLFSIVILSLIGIIYPANLLIGQGSLPFSDPGDQYERIYPTNGVEVITSSFYPIERGHAMLGLEILNEEQDRAILTFLDFKGTINNSLGFTYAEDIEDGEDVAILETGDVIRLADGTFAFSVILDKDSLNKAITRIDQAGNILWTELTGQESDTKDLRSSKSILLEIGNRKIWHAHIVEAIGNTTDVQITEFDYEGNKNSVSTFSVGTDGRLVLDEDLIQMTIGIDSSIMILGTTDNPDVPFFLSKMDTTGSVLWTRGYNGDYGRNLDRQGYDLVQLVDTTWVVTGSVLGTQTQRNEGFIMHVSDDGARLRTMSISPTTTRYQLYPSGVVQLQDSTITISLTQEDMITEDLNPLIFNYDLDSILGYQVLLDTVYSSDPRFSELTTTDSISVSYITTGFKNEDRVPYLSKIDGIGGTQCEETTNIIQIDSVDFTDEVVLVSFDEKDIDVDSIESEPFPYGRFSPPILSLQDTTYCPQDPISYIQDATVRGGTEYIWEDNSTDPVRLFTEEGMYMVTVTVREDLCFKLCDTMTITKLERPMVVIEKNTSGFCVTGDIILSATESGSVAESFLWSNGETSRSITVPGVAGDSYTVMITDGCDLTADASTTITEADLIPPVEGTIVFSCGNPGQLTVNGSGFSALLWSTGDSSRLLNINSADTYSVTLFDQCGEAIENVDEITISENDLDDCTSCDNPCLTWPNALHPENREPENQVFGPVLRNGCENLIEDYELKIFNRWGKNIYSTTDVTATWNGAINGSNQPGGVYYYWATYSDGTTTCERRGDMTLLR